jgi:hypothetical protein
MTVVNPNQSPAGPDFRAGERMSTSWSTFPTRPRTRRAGDLFQPVTSSEAPPAAIEPSAAIASSTAVTEQLVTPINEPSQAGELISAPTPPSALVPPPRRWASRVAGLAVGTSGAVMAFVASAVLVLVVAGMTMFRTASSPESPVAEAAPGRLPAPATPVVSGQQPVTVAPIDAPAGVAQPVSATVYSPAQPAATAAQQHAPTPPHRDLPAAQVARPAPDHGPVSPPPSFSPPSSTTEDGGTWTISNASRTENTESQPVGTQPCRCDATMRENPDDEYRPSTIDRPREPGAQQARYRPASKVEKSRIEDRMQDRQASGARDHGRPSSIARPRP